MLAPRDRAARVVVLLHGEVDHEAVGGGAVPVVLAGLEEDAVAGADLFNRAAFALAAADALGDVDRLAVRVGVPGGARTGREVHERGGEGRRRFGRGDRVDVDVAREPVGGALLRLDAAAGDLHVGAPSVGDQAALRASVSARVGTASRGLAAVDDHGVADRERGLLGAQPDHGGGDLLRAPHAADGLLGDDRGAAFVGVAGEAAHHLGVDDAGADRVDADALGGVVERGGLRQADQAVLGRGVGGLALEALDARA